MAEEETTLPVNYTLGHDPETLKSHRQREASFCAASLLPYIQPAAHILDVGCGPGTITLGLAERAPAGRTVGIDYSPTAVAAAQQEALARGGPARCEFQVGNAYALAWGAETFDVVHAHQCLIHLADPVASLREMRRVCKVGGIVAARDGDFGAFHLYPESPLLLKTIAIIGQVLRAGGSEPNAGRRLISWARQAGYGREQLRVRVSAEVYSTREERDFIATRYYQRLRHSEMGRRGVELGITSPEEIDRIEEAWKSWIEDDDGYLALPSTDILCWKQT